MGFSVISFPFEQIGWGLRQLSLSGAVGNIIAIVLYVLLSMSPCVVGVVLWRKKKLHLVDLGLPVLSVAMFIMMYFMVNPGLFELKLPGMEKVMLAGTFYSLLVGYLTIRFLTRILKADKVFLQKAIRAILVGIEIIYLWVIGNELICTLPQTIMDAWSYGVFVYAFLCMRSFLSLLPCMCEMVLYFLIIVSINRLLKDSHSEVAIASVKRIGNWCIASLIIIVVSNALFNLLQLMARLELYDIAINTSIPLFTVILLLAIIVFAKYVEENQKLKQDNDMFI